MSETQSEKAAPDLIEKLAEIAATLDPDAAPKQNTVSDILEANAVNMETPYFTARILPPEPKGWRKWFRRQQPGILIHDGAIAFKIPFAEWVTLPTALAPKVLAIHKDIPGTFVQLGADASEIQWAASATCCLYARKPSRESLEVEI